MRAGSTEGGLDEAIQVSPRLQASSWSSSGDAWLISVGVELVEASLLRWASVISWRNPCPTHVNLFRWFSKRCPGPAEPTSPWELVRGGKFSGLSLDLLNRNLRKKGWVISFHKASRWFYFHPVAMLLEAGVGEGSEARGLFHKRPCHSDLSWCSGFTPHFNHQLAIPDLALIFPSSVMMKTPKHTWFQRTWRFTNLYT